MGISFRQLLRARLRGVVQLLGAWVGNPPTGELLYAQAFLSSAASLGIALPALYPLGAAANYSLMYVVLRTLTETPASRILDIGVGQSTLLVGAIAQSRAIEVVSVESDRAWASRMASLIKHPVIYSPLVKRRVHGHNADCFGSVELSGRFDTVIVDGPIGSRRRSRWGVLELLDRYLAEEFVVIFDDASRRGELDTILEFVKCHASRVSTRFVHGGKSQCVIYTEQFAGAGIF